MARRIAFINEKGGSCKTTLTSSVGDFLARERGQRVLLIDLDPQGQLGKVLGVDVGALRRSALDLLLDALLDGETTKALPSVRARHPRLDLVPANKSLALFASQAVEHTGDDALALRRALEKVEMYDFVLFDAPPSFGTITLNALLAAEEIVLPVPLTFLALDGAAELARTVEMVRTRFGHAALSIRLVVPTFWRRTKLAAEVLEKLRENFPRELSRVLMGYSVLVDEAQSRGKTIFEYAPRSTAARRLGEIADEVLACGARRSDS